MKKYWHLALAAGLALVATLLFPVSLAAEVSEAPAIVRRFALIAGANNGGRQRVLLRYAGSDARALAEVLETLGGVDPKDRLMLLDPGRAALLEAFARLGEKLRGVQRPRERSEVIFYYSGHSDETGLLLREDLVSYKDLRGLLDGLTADVRIAILDSCSSGALTRRKGGIKRPPFLVDTSNPVKGKAFLTSASATEAAQESDRIRGSFFTHYLVSGLRGAADVTDDRRVTLSEAYQFAFHETLARTEKTQAGPQHPNYDFQLAGAGDLVLTDLRGTSATLEIAAGVAGRVFLRDREGRLVVELRKVTGRAVRLGLDAGRYRVVLEQQREAFAADVTLVGGQTTFVERSDLETVDLEEAVARGPAPDDKENEKLFTDTGGYNHIAVCVSVVPGVGTCSGSSEAVHTNIAINIFGGYDARLHGWGASPFFLVSTDEVKGAQVSGFANVTGALRGAQGSGMFNLAYGSADAVQVTGMLNLGLGAFRGVQASGMVNISGGNSPWLVQGSGMANVSMAHQFRGAQVTGMINILKGEMMAGTQISGLVNGTGGPFKGAQLTGMVNLSGPFTGLQTAGVLNLAGGAVQGAQITGLVNLSGSFYGLQTAGMLNLAGGAVRGAQVSGIANVGGDLRGTQLSSVTNFAAGDATGLQVALLNVSGDLDGVQAGLLNIAAGKVTGLQLGLLNVAKTYDDGSPFGLFNAILDVPVHVDLWFSDLTAFNAGFKFGGEYIYTMLSTGYSPAVGRKLQRFTLELTLGLRFEPSALGGVYFAMDGSAGQLVLFNDEQPFGFADPSRSNMINRWRLLAGYKFFEHLGVFGGVALNVVYKIGNQRDRAGLPDGQWAFTRYGNSTARLWPGFLLGVQM